jgi:hypothetical protein
VPKNFKPKTQLCNFWQKDIGKKVLVNVDKIDPWLMRMFSIEYLAFQCSYCSKVRLQHVKINYALVDAKTHLLH